MKRQDWRDFFITVFFLGNALIVALLSSLASKQNQMKLAAAIAAVSLVMAGIGGFYIVPRLARRVRLDFLSFAVRTNVTAEGAVFVVFLLVVAFAAWNTANNLLYLVFSAMFAFLFVANIIAHSSLSNLSVQLRFRDHIFAGEPVSLSVTVTNQKRLIPSFSLVIETTSEPEKKAKRMEYAVLDDENKHKDRDGGGKSKVKNDSTQSGSISRNKCAPLCKEELGKLGHFIIVPSGASARQRTERTFNHRGCYPITAFKISTMFPTGFFKKWRNVEASGELIVYPKPLPIDDFYHTLPMLAGQVSSLMRGSGDDLYAIRRYHPSDHMRHIDWKATAKSMRLMVRENTREDERRLTIVFDTSRPDGEGFKTGAGPPQTLFDEKFERAIVMAASLANHFIQERADVELITPDENHNVTSGRTQERLYEIFKSLATLQPDEQKVIPDKSKEKLSGRLNRFFSNRTRDGSKAGTTKDESSDHAAPLKMETWGLTRLMDEVPFLADERHFKVVITSAKKGTIPAGIWRSAHIVFMQDL